MGKKFTKLTTISSNEVSLCTKYNSGANKQTEFELIKDKEHKTLDIKPVLKSLLEMEEEIPDKTNGFKEFIEYWMEYDINNCFYNLLNDGLHSSLCHIQYDEELTKEQKAEEYKKLFSEFVDLYINLPITKTKDGYTVSLASDSHIQETNANPQNETENITKEKTSKMEEKLNQAFDMIKSLLKLEKNETPAETQEVEPEVEAPAEPVEQPAEPVEQPAEPVEEKPEGEPQAEPVEEKPEVEAPAEDAEVETPVVEEEVEKTVEPTEEPTVEPKEEAPVEPEAVEKTESESQAESVEVVEEVQKSSEPSELEVALEKAKSLESELEALKKASEEKEIAIEKMSFIQKAKDEYSMLVGTPEEIGEKLYSIAKSSLDDSTKEFVLEQLKKVSKENAELTEEVGSITKNANAEVSEEDVIYAKAEEIAKSKNISINKALREVK